jgi:hypothetical protein
VRAVVDCGTADIDFDSMGVLRHEINERIGQRIVQFETAALDALGWCRGGGGVPASGGVAHV